VKRLTSEFDPISNTAYYCEKHNGFFRVKETYHKFDFKIECEKLMAKLECGCELWIATVERSTKVGNKR